MFKKTIWLLSLCLFSLPVLAETSDELTPVSRSISVLLGFPVGGSLVAEGESTTVRGNPVSGFIAVGGDYELRTRKGLGYGGYLRFYNTSDTIENRVYGVSLLAIGGFFRGHLRQNDFDFYLSPGLGIMNGDVTASDAKAKFGLLLTPSIALGATYRISENYSVGFENMRSIALSGSVSGTVIDDYMIKVDYTF